MPQRFIPGPGPGVGMHSAQQRINANQAPRPAVVPLQNSPDMSQLAMQFDDGMWRDYRNPDVTGYGALLTSKRAVDYTPVLQSAYKLKAPRRTYSMGYKQQYEAGPMLREQERVHAPLRLLNTPGSIHYQRQVVTSQVNARQNLLYQHVRAPRINESQSTLVG